MNSELKNELIEVINEYKNLSNFIENEVPYKYAEDIRQELFFDNYLDGLISQINEVELVKA
ncbi:hypothetical protein ACFQZE_06600 [Paenibacillus sp. GCM10027627]|uniref:hypothetical protein n=1 Tax=unclassified Paenibacillus TaxID=185978 RepID=UPI003628FB4A